MMFRFTLYQSNSPIVLSLYSHLVFGRYDYMTMELVKASEENSSL